MTGESANSCLAKPGFFDDLPVDQVRDFEAELYKYVDATNPGLLRTMMEKKVMSAADSGSGMYQTPEGIIEYIREGGFRAAKRDSKSHGMRNEITTSKGYDHKQRKEGNPL